MFLEEIRDNISTRVNDLGLIEIVPANTTRYHYDPVNLAPLGLLIEPEAQQLIAPGDISLCQQNRVTDGALHIDSPAEIPNPLFTDTGFIYIVFGNGTSDHHVVRTHYPGVRFNVYRTLSVYMKMRTCRFDQIFLEGDAMFANFNLELGVRGRGDAPIRRRDHYSGGERLVPVLDADHFD